jgi:Tol biopolymer transport system component
VPRNATEKERLAACARDYWRAIAGKYHYQLTSKGTDTMPAWAPDGQTVYFVQTVPKEAYPNGKDSSKYTFYVTDITSITADGKNRTKLTDSLTGTGQGSWSNTSEPCSM